MTATDLLNQLLNPAVGLCAAIGLTLGIGYDDACAQLRRWTGRTHA